MFLYSAEHILGESILKHLMIYIFSESTIVSCISENVVAIPMPKHISSIKLII